MFKEKNKKIIFNLAFLLLFSFLIAFFVLDFNSSIEDPNEICLQINSPLKKYCLAVVNQDDYFCQELTGDDQKKCLAMAQKDIDYCGEIEESNMKNDCYNNLVLFTDKIQYCEETENIEDCYFSYIKSSYLKSNFEVLKKEYCDKVDQSKKQACLALVEQDRSLCHGRLFCLNFFEEDSYLCKGIRGEDKIECLKDRALIKKDVKACEEVNDSRWEDICYFDYASNIEPDTSICNKINNQELKQSCYSEIAIYLSKLKND